MTKQLITIGPKDPLTEVKAIFDNHRIHHIPVVKFRNIVGMVSKTDFLHFVRGMHQSSYDQIVETTRLQRYCAEDIMTRGLAKLEADDRINVAVEVFRENLFHALPVLKDNELVGIVTTFDLIKMLSDEDNQRIAALKSEN
jgi:acetoin utilization protein AcuB